MAVKLVNLCQNLSADYIIIFCPHAGGTPNQYKHFSKYLPPQFKLIGALLPGREGWYTSDPVTSLQDLSVELAHLVEQLCNENIVLFGHSMGALLAYETARRIRGVVSHLFVSGHVAPHIRLPNLQQNSLDNESLKKVMIELSGTPKEIMEDNELLEMILPTMRHDFKLCDTYNFVDDQTKRLDCAITAFGGIEDNRMEEYGMAAWLDYTSRHFECFRYPGNHFFIMEHSFSIAQKMVQRIEAD